MTEAKSPWPMESFEAVASVEFDPPQSGGTVVIRGHDGEITLHEAPPEFIASLNIFIAREQPERDRRRAFGEWERFTAEEFGQRADLPEASAAPKLPPAFYAAPAAPGPHEHDWVTRVDWSDHWGFQPPDQDKRSIRPELVFCAVPGCDARP